MNTPIKKSKLLREIIAEKMAIKYEEKKTISIEKQNEKKIAKARNEYYCK